MSMLALCWYSSPQDSDSSDDERQYKKPLPADAVLVPQTEEEDVPAGEPPAGDETTEISAVCGPASPWMSKPSSSGIQQKRPVFVEDSDSDVSEIGRVKNKKRAATNVQTMRDLARDSADVPDRRNKRDYGNDPDFSPASKGKPIVSRKRKQPFRLPPAVNVSHRGAFKLVSEAFVEEAKAAGAPADNSATRAMTNQLDQANARLRKLKSALRQTIQRYNNLLFEINSLSRQASDMRRDRDRERFEFQMDTHGTVQDTEDEEDVPIPDEMDSD